MALTPEQIKDEASYYGFIGNTDQLVKFARAIESEVRKQDGALIQQMLTALDECDYNYKRVEEAIVAASERLKKL